jgi:hypothetical protein
MFSLFSFFKQLFQMFFQSLFIKLSLQGNEKGPDAQAEQFRQMLSQHMVSQMNFF